MFASAAMLLAALSSTAPVQAQDSPRGGLTYQDLLRRPAHTPTARIPYGSAPSQFVELWLPAGPGPFPVAVIIHGGCWRANLPGFALMNLAASDLRQHGVAVWNVEYRRLGEAGGGYPETYEDVAAALDLLKSKAGAYGLKLGKVVVVGHSAGGHLALWAAGRARLPATSPLRTDDPLKITAVVSLGGFSDLQRQRTVIEGACGKVVDAMTGAPGPTRLDVFADTSPAALAPLGAAQYLVHGALDPVSPPTMDLAYQDLARKRGDKVERRTIGEAGHFELIAPGEQAWSSSSVLIRNLLK